MERSYKVPWYMILSIAILFELLSHTRRLLTHFQMEGDQLLSNFIIYAGIPLFILILISMFFSKGISLSLIPNSFGIRSS